MRWANLFAPGLLGRRAFIEWLVVGLVSALIVFVLDRSDLADRVDFLIYDHLMRLYQAEPIEDITIVAIDDPSLNALGLWPWPRTHHAQLLDRLSEHSPKAIAYDVLFLESTAADTELARAIRDAGNVYLPVLVDTPGHDGAPWIVREPTPVLNQAAAGTGHVNLTIDSDGVVRRLPIYLQTGTQLWPHLMLSLTRHEAFAKPYLNPMPLPDQEPLQVLLPLPLMYRGGPGSVQTVSFIDVLNSRVPTELLRDRLVLVGATAAGMGDRYATPDAPHGELMRGVELQANLLATMIEGGGPERLPQTLSLLISLIPLLALLVGFLLLRPQLNMLLGLGLMGLVVLVSLSLFMGFRIWFAPTPALAGLILAYPLWSWRKLETASTYMQSELDAFEREHHDTLGYGLTLNTTVMPEDGGDVVSRQVAALSIALRRLRDFEGFILGALTSLPDATVIADIDGNILIANDRAKVLFGALSQPGRTLDALFQSLGEPGWRRLVEIPTAERYNLITRSGHVLRPAAVALKNSLGETSHLLMSFADMTQIRSVERQKEQAVQLLTHDLRAPLVSILSLIDQTETDEPSPRDRRIFAYARQTLDLAEGYVQLARAESQPYKSLPVDVVQVAMDAADLLWPQALAKGATIETTDSDTPVLVRGDPGLLRRMIINLMDNGLKYGPPGQVLKCEIRVVGPESRRLCQIRVSDRGPGLSQASVENLFQVFSQSGTERSGVGLGLAFVRTVAERHGGHVTYRAGNPGATFIVTLPLMAKPADY